MNALITGASSGIGREIAIYLSELGYDLILVARNKEKLLELQNEIKTNNKNPDMEKIKDIQILKEFNIESFTDCYLDNTFTVFKSVRKPIFSHFEEIKFNSSPESALLFSSSISGKGFSNERSNEFVNDIF